MATIFETKRIECKLRRINADRHGDFGFEAEPYIWPFFYKLDGETIDVEVNIDFLTGMNVRLNGEPTVRSKSGSHGNIPAMGDGDFVDVPNSVGRFRDSLVPMPVSINVNLPSFAEEIIEDAVIKLIEIIEIIDDDRTCPPIKDFDFDMVGDFIAEFISGTIGGLPAFCGGAYILMEEDNTREEAAEDSRKTIKSTIKNQLQEAIDELNILLRFPMELNPDTLTRITDVIDTAEDIEHIAVSDITGLLILDTIHQGLVGAGIGAGVGGVVGIGGGLLGVLLGGIVGGVVGALIGANPDDPLLAGTVQFSHFNTDDVPFETENIQIRIFSNEEDPRDEFGVWRMSGRISIRN